MLSPLLSLNAMLTRCSSGIMGHEIVQSVQANVVHGTCCRAMEATTTIGRIFTSISEVQSPTLQNTEDLSQVTTHVQTPVRKRKT